MDLCASQHRQVKQLWRRFVSRPPTDGSSGHIDVLDKKWSDIIGADCRLAMWQTMGINFGMFAYFTISVQKAGERAVKNYSQTWIHSATEIFNSEYGKRKMKEVWTSARTNTQTRFFERWALFLGTRRIGDPLWENSWWTVVTKAFVHADVKHLVGNLSALYTFGTTVSRVAHMKALDMWAVAIGSSLAGSFATLANIRWLMNGHSYGWAMGASGIVNAYMAITALGSPDDELDMIPSASIPTGLIVALNIGYDVLLWTSQVWGWDSALPKDLRKLFFSGDHRRTNAAAHLAGAAFGAAYYYFVLRPRAQGSQDRPRGRALQDGRLMYNTDR